MAPLKPTGFWSYTSADDAASDGRLSRLRAQLANRLRQQLGRPVNLFQDVAAIPPGTAWESQIETAVTESSFFIPIITPGFLQSEWCTREVRRFRDHMQRLGRDDLILPVHYLDVSAFKTVRRADCIDIEVFDYLQSLQWVDFRAMEPLDSNTAEVRVWLAGFASRIEEALYRKTAPMQMPVPPAGQPSAPPSATLPADPPPPAKRTGATWRWLLPGAAALGILLFGYFGLMKEKPTARPDGKKTEYVDTAPPLPQSPLAAVAQPPRELRDECPSTAICPELMLVPRGTFLMGVTTEEQDREKVPKKDRAAEKPQHSVTIGYDFYLSKYTVTRAEFEAFVQATAPRPAGACWTYEKDNKGLYQWQSKDDRDWENPGFQQTGRDPVVCVNQEDAEAYVRWLNSVTKPGSYRLPSESEWEYAARATTTTARFWGDGRDQACLFANVRDQTLAAQIGDSSPNPDVIFHCNDGYPFTAPVGSFKPNKFGLYDMLGNVWQWTADCWNDDYKTAAQGGSTNKTGDCSRRVVRGGSWDDFPRDVRAGVRIRFGTEIRDANIGFRVARTP